MRGVAGVFLRLVDEFACGCGLGDVVGGTMEHFGRAAALGDRVHFVAFSAASDTHV